MKKTFQVRCKNESDNWSKRGPAITSDATLNEIRAALSAGPVIVEHGHYRGGSAPTRVVLEDWEDFEEYLQSKAFAGDTIDVWSFGDCCRPDSTIASGKCPDETGQTPEGGSY